MGRDKALLPWRNGTLLSHMMGLFGDVVDVVRVVGREELPDEVMGRGPLGGILTALDVTDADINLIVAVDLPFLTQSFLEFLRDATMVNDGLGVACNIDAQIPLCLGLKRDAAPIARKRIEAGNLSVHGFVTNANLRLISEEELNESGFDTSLFRNLNTEEEYLRLRP